MKNEKFNHFRISDCFKRFVCIFTCFILCIYLFPPSLSFADTEPFTDSITYVQNGGNLLPSSETTSGKYPLVINNNNNNTNQYITYWKQTSTVPDIDIYAFLVDNVPYVVVPLYDTSLGGFVYASLQTRDSYNSRITFSENQQGVIYDEDRQLLYSYFNRNSNTTVLPSFNSVEDGLNAISGGESLPNDGFDGTLLIEAGYAAYIRVNGGDMDLTCTMNELSGLIMGGSPWGNTSSIAYGVGSLPDSSTKFPLSSMSHIPWMKRAQGQNWLGQTRYAGYPRSGLTTEDNYIVIYNPAQPYLSSKGTDELSPTITAHFTKLVDYIKYPLTQRYDSETGGTSSDSISGYTDFYSGIPDSNGNFSEVPSSSSIPPVAIPGGTGDLATSGSASISDYINQLTQTLSNFANSVVELLKAPISHIGELISAGSGFMSSLRGMYAWLPVDIQGLIIAALTVVIGIGVFKVFL